MEKLRLVLLSLVLVASHSSLAQSLVDRAQRDELVFMADEDPAMVQAFEKARATLDDFLLTAQSPPPGTSSFAIKVGVRDGDDVEYFWITDFAETDGLFSGKIDNQPRLVKTVQFGQVYRFPKGHIVDWTYVDVSQGRMLGNFTACALLTKESPSDAQAMKERYGLECE